MPACYAGAAGSQHDPHVHQPTQIYGLGPRDGMKSDIIGKKCVLKQFKKQLTGDIAHIVRLVLLCGVFFLFL